MEKVVLIDGNNILFRSYYATAYNGVIMRNSKGFPTNALYGLINMLNKIINEEKPNYLMVALDKGKTFRHEKYLDYKAGRSETPDDLKLQLKKAREVIDAMGIKYFEIDGYEADDIIGTFAKKIEEDDNFDGTIISSDKDLLQLISEQIDVKLLKQVGYIRMTKEEFINTYGIEPIRMIDLKALMGDPSDNIPGVKGIGEKTAINLLKEFDNVDNLYENIDSVKGKVKEKLLLEKDKAYMSKDLATIYREVPIDTDFTNILYKGLDKDKYISLLQELEFFSLLKKMDKEEVEEVIPKPILKSDNKGVIELDDLSDIKLDEYAIYLETLGYNYHDAKALGIGIYNKDVNYYISFETLERFPDFLNSDVIKWTYDLKKLLVVLKKHNLSIKNCNFDVMIAAYLLNYNVKDDVSILGNALGYSLEFYESEFGSLAKLKEPEKDIIIKNVSLKTKFIYDIKEKFEKELKDNNSDRLFYDIEMPLVDVLADMELTGIDVSKEYLEKMGIDLKNKIGNIEQEIYVLAGREFNISSPKQLGEVLFVDLKIPYPKKIKDNNYSTSKDILDKLLPYYPIIEKILEYRTLTKLYTNYIVGLIAEIKDDGKVHTIFNQTLTRTGRLSSTSPNLQNIPIRLEYGSLIRKAFVPSPNSVILSSDYSQIELRVFAHMSNAHNLIEAFNHDLDIHTKTAMDVFHVSKEEVTKDMRRTAKAVNFGILYGISSFGLSEDLGIDVKTAKSFIDTYLDTYKGIREYMDLLIKDAYLNGYVKTIMNRKRNIEELGNKNHFIKSQGERIALNTPIQGSSADILKKAMIEIYDEFNKRNLKSKMLIQVHDELVFNVLKDELDEVKNIVKDIMENTYKLNVPLKVDINYGDNWKEAK